MPPPKPRTKQRSLDIVLLGATGFTGALTAEYLAEHAPTGLRWALAGRNRSKLEAVRDRLAKIDDSLADLELIEADSADRASLDAMVGRTKVVISTVGPYVEFGEPLVAACAAAGTDYVDLTGEPLFVDRMYVAHHATAEKSGARIVHCCGFDSIPHDLGAYYTVKELAAKGPVAVRGAVRAGAMASGGTFHSAMGIMSRARETREAAKARRLVEGRPEGRSSKAVAGKPHRDKVLGWWLLPLPTIDPTVVARSGAALPAYGPRFTYSHYVGAKKPWNAAGVALGAGAIMATAQVPPLRNFLLGRIKQGEGPDEARRAKSWFSVDFVGEGDGRTVHTRVRGGDPGYGETSKMLAESALCLAFDDNPKTSGCVTTAQAMGDNLMARLIAAGIKFQTL
jgi:short subunit dehydrogenase-like uncharacterized protein